MKLEFSGQIFEEYPNTKFHQNPSSRSRWADMTKLTVANSNLANAPPQKNFLLRDLRFSTAVKTSSVLGCHAVSTDKQLPMFRGSAAPPSSGSNMDRAMVPVISRRPLHTEDWVRSQDSPCGNFGQQTGNGTGFLHVTSLFLC